MTLFASDALYLLESKPIRIERLSRRNCVCSPLLCTDWLIGLPDAVVLGLRRPLIFPFLANQMQKPTWAIDKVQLVQHVSRLCLRPQDLRRTEF